MQFKGSLRSPGDRDSGVRVVLTVDEYHLEIHRGREMVGRWYLGDVEVARDIAEKFILFLGEDEVEFLADDALKFAYDGVTAMQEGWLRGQKNKRRQRKAAELAARKKDETPEPTHVGVTMPAQPDYLTESDSVRARRRRAGESERRPAASDLTRRIAAGAEQPAPETASPVSWLEPLPDRGEPSIEGDPALNGKSEGTSLAARRRAAAATAAGAGKISEREGKHPGAGAPDTQPPPVERPVQPAARMDPGIERRERRSRRPDRHRDLAPRVEIAEPAEAVLPEPAPVDEQAAAGAMTDDELEVRFAPEGHHPAETSTGLLARLRRQPKPPTDHVHKFRESGSSVGLVRRVCVECSYVSIGSED